MPWRPFLDHSDNQARNAAQQGATDPAPLELEATQEMVRAAKAQGIALIGPNGLLKQLITTVVEVSLEEEMTDHLGYAKHEVTGREAVHLGELARSRIA